MVLKRCNEYLQKLDLFENDVKMYGTQTKEKVCICIAQFENDVKMYGTQTAVADIGQQCKFENDVKMYGTQTKHREIIKDSYTWNFKNVAYSA